MKLHSLIGLMAVFVLSACGFHLRGMGGESKQPLPFKEFAIESSDAGMLSAVRNQVVSQPDMALVELADAKGVIKVLQARTQREVSAVNLSGSAIEYLLILQVDAQVLVDGKLLREKPITATVRRHMDYANTEILGKNEEQDQLWADMRQDAASNLLRQVRVLINEQSALAAPADQSLDSK